MKSKIIIKGMHFKAYHGYYKEERKIGGQYIVDLEMEYDIRQAADEDNLNATINYEVVYQLCREEMKHNRKLIETVALSIVEKIQKKFPELDHITLELHKTHPPLDGLIDRATVRIEV